jgi:hypothetical protein
LLLWDTAAIRYGTFVEFSYHRIFKLITTLGLATCLVLLAIAGVYANHIHKVIWICDALGKLASALVE